MALGELFSYLTSTGLIQSLLLSILLAINVVGIRRAFFHPLSSLPGPLLARITPIWLWYHVWKGDEASIIWNLHQLHGPIVRVGPNDVDIADGAALHSIYAEKGGFLKHPCYSNFDLLGHPTIFSALDPEHRKPRARAVVSMFATGSIYPNSDSISEAADVFVQRLRAATASGRQVNVLNLARCFALDSLSAYLFGVRYGGLDETSDQFSASRAVDFFVAFGRFFYLPKCVFKWVEWICEKLFLDEAAAESLAKVGNFARKLVQEHVADAARDSKASTYQGKLLDAGFTEHEVEQQCQDLIFAGTDSTAMNLATMCWHLVRHPTSYDRLRREVVEAKTSNEFTADKSRIQGLPYLRAVVLEGLRISLANPTRLPRIVPAEGWEWNGFVFPSGTSVGVGSYQLHRNEDVFAEARQFVPERWLNANAEMHRDNMAFGIGTRQCIARNLATAELLVAMSKVAESGVLQGLRAVGDEIEIVEWFNSVVTGGKIELVQIPK